MFEVAEVGHEIGKDAYAAQLATLRKELLDAQLELVRERPFPVIVIVSGVEGAGKGEVVHLLNQWLDPRHVETHAIGTITKVEHEHPAMWRFWMHLPPKGKVGLFFGSWYTTPLFDRAYHRMKRGAFERTLEQIVRFEKMLTDEGVVVVKIWLHLGKARQRRTFKKLERVRATRWRVSKSDWDNHRRYGSFKRTAAEALRRTSTSNAPWIVVDASDARHRNLMVGEAVATAMRRGLERARAPLERVVSAPAIVTGAAGLLPALDHTQQLAREAYKEQLPLVQGELNVLSRVLKERGKSVVVAFEGFDAAGKGGAIRRLTQALDARHYAVIPVAAPTDEERARPYLWRFWRHIPGNGGITIFDRSWYGRVLVERVEGLCSSGDVMRAYAEINDFEDQLATHGSIVLKFFISVTKDEQLRRFEARRENPLKRFKLTDEDWRNRDKWDAYEQAVGDMVERTSTPSAPWTLVEGNDKSFARMKVLRTVVERLEAELDP